MKASEVMTRPVITVEPDANVDSAIRLMLQNRISGLPVVDAGGRLVGILTEGDLLRRAETGTQRQRPRWLEFLLGPGKMADDYVRTHARKVKEIMTPEIETVGEDAPLEDVVELMERWHIKRVPVVNGGKLVGIISRANLLQALASIARTAPEPSADDAGIRKLLLDEMDKQPWAPKGLINIIVKDGVVELWGSITDEREREAMHVLVENTPGVKDVRDHLAWVEPLSGAVIEPPEDTSEQAKVS